MKTDEIANSLIVAELLPSLANVFVIFPMLRQMGTVQIGLRSRALVRTLQQILPPAKSQG